ncbi:MAG: ABC transporter permease, partial [Thermoanaerobacteraceae bacterium]|nr:ABC transporter permease [Thermoanaerobacteraceae bacterium]
SFLGVCDPALLSWGKMMQQALKFTYLEAWKWWLIPPGVALSLTVTALTLIGYALEGVLNPRLRGER